MSKEFRGYRGSALSNAAGTLAGFSLSAFAAHYLIPDSEALRVISEMLGSGAGGWGGAYLNDHLLPHLPRRWRLLRLLRRKLASDFAFSYLDDTIELRIAATESYDILRAAQVTRENAPMLGSELLGRIPAKRLDRDARSHYENVLYQKQPIRINCAALFPASLAVLLSLKERLKNTVVLEIDYSDINSHDQFERVSLGDRFDFIVAAEAPLFLITSKFNDGRIEATELFKYKRLLPCNIEWQYAFLRKGNRAPRSMHVYQSSSAKLQYQIGIGRGEYRVEERKTLQGKQMAFFADKHALDPGDCLLVWEPLADLFHDNPHFERLKIDRFKVWISLFCSADWALGFKDKQLEAFRRLFIDEWRELREALNQYERAYKILISHHDLVDKFAHSAGLEKDPRYSLNTESQI